MVLLCGHSERSEESLCSPASPGSVSSPAARLLPGVVTLSVVIPSPAIEDSGSAERSLSDETTGAQEFTRGGPRLGEQHSFTGWPIHGSDVDCLV